MRVNTGARLQPVGSFSPAARARIDAVLADFDDTLTTGGVFPAASYAALERLSAAGKWVVVVTGRPAGWCDMIARFFPVAGVVGENGAFYFRYSHKQRRMARVFERTDAARSRDRAKLARLFAELKRAFPGARLASDQAYRISDIAIDFREDVRTIPMKRVLKMREFLEARGATVKISSIHLNAWIGRFDKLSMVKRFLADELRMSPAAVQSRAAYVGDSPNDEPMFAFFKNSVGVANVRDFAGQMKALPAFVTRSKGGQGFVEFANLILGAGKS